jgi:hypothetical protein
LSSDVVGIRGVVFYGFVFVRLASYHQGVGWVSAVRVF